MRRLLVPPMLLAGLVATAAAQAQSVDASCGLAVMKAPDTSPERLNACARAIALRPAPVDEALLHAALGGLADASITRPLDDAPHTGRRLLAELQARGAARAADRASLRDVLLAAGRFDEAAASGAEGPPLPVRQPLAHAAAPGEARYWRWDAAGRALQEQAVDLGHGVHLVVDASPGCHFCAKAVVDIDRDPALAELFRHALWISRPEQGLDAAWWQRWNDAHPSHAMVVVTDASNWALSAQWSTPRFRFFRDGRVVASVLGWTPDSRAALLRAARVQGLVPEASARRQAAAPAP